MGSHNLLKAKRAKIRQDCFPEVDDGYARNNRQQAPNGPTFTVAHISEDPIQGCHKQSPNDGQWIGTCQQRRSNHPDKKPIGIIEFGAKFIGNVVLALISAIRRATEVGFRVFAVGSILLDVKYIQIGQLIESKHQTTSKYDQPIEMVARTEIGKI